MIGRQPTGAPMALWPTRCWAAPSATVLGPHRLSGSTVPMSGEQGRLGQATVG